MSEVKLNTPQGKREIQAIFIFLLWLFSHLVYKSDCKDRRRYNLCIIIIDPNNSVYDYSGRLKEFKGSGGLEARFL